MSMPSGKQTESGPLARSVAAEVRAAMGRRRVSGAQLAALSGISQNYIAKRLRDDAPFTLNDVEKICDVLNEDFTQLILHATKNIGKEE